MANYPLSHLATWIDGEMVCTDHGKFERRGIVRHSKTGKLVTVKADVADTFFSIPATTQNEHGYVSVVDLGDYGTELHFRPHTEQKQSPAAYRREVRKAYK